MHAMEPAGLSSPMEAHLVACIQESLALYLHSNAQFLAERLCAQFPSKVGVHAAIAVLPASNALQRPLASSLLM